MEGMAMAKRDRDRERNLTESPEKKTKTRKRAPWKERYANDYYVHVMRELPPLVGNDGFNVKSVFGRLKCLQRLSDNYAFDVAMAVFNEAAKKGDLVKIGRTYYQNSAFEN